MQKELKISVPLADGDREAVSPEPAGQSLCPPLPAERELLTPVAGASGCQPSPRFKVVEGVFEPEGPLPITPQQVK